MTTLERLLKPKTIALIGGAWTKNVEDQLSRLGFDGAVYHVHPKGALTSVNDLPVVPDAAFIAINRTAAVNVVADLAAQGAGGVICFASGFEESGADGAALQEALVSAAGDMPLLGPNCYGLVNYLDGIALWPDVHGGKRVDRGVALITQSSNVLINMSMQQRGLPLAYLLAAGNGAQTGLAELILAMDADPRVTAIGLHIEGFGDAKAFHDACCHSSKPIIALKAGESEAAQALTVSHTASLSGSAAVASAFLDRCGVGQVDTLEGFIETLKVLHVTGPLADRTLASVSCSGGEASLMADLGARYGFTFPDLGALGIAETLNPLVQVTNPFDYHTFDWGNRDALFPAFCKVLSGPQAFTAFLLDWPREGSGDVTGFEIAVTTIIEAAQATGKPAGILSTYPENMPKALAERLCGQGLVPLCGLSAGLEGLAAARARSSGPFIPLHPPRGPRQQISEYAAKQDLQAHNIAVPQGFIAHSADDLATKPFARTVMKVVDDGLAHKTEVGGVLLDVQDLGKAYETLKAIAPQVLVEEMVEGVVAELIVGLAYDPVVGGHLVVGAGGVLTELLDDTAILLFPFTSQDAVQAVQSLRIYGLLKGYRGKASANIDTLAQTLVQVAERALVGDMLELDVNPLMVTPTRAVVADALMVLAKEDPA